jgi:hypothetical protein
VEPRISGKEATQVTDGMAKRGPIRLLAPSELQEVAGAPATCAVSEQDRKTPPRLRKPLARNDQCFAPTPDLDGHRSGAGRGAFQPQRKEPRQVMDMPGLPQSDRRG